MELVFGGHFTSVLAGRSQRCAGAGHPRHYVPATMLPLGKPTKEITKLRRGKVEEFATVERFDGAKFEG